MSAQYVYLARHGETAANNEKIIQGPHEPLSPRGHEQAARLAKRAANLTFHHLLASDYLRAQETASYIAAQSGFPIETDSLLREFARPTSLEGTSRSSQTFTDFLAAEIANHGNPTWKYEDGDTYLETHERAGAALQKFQSYGDAPLFVVTHGVFLRFIAAHILLGAAPIPERWGTLSRAFNVHNTGITVLRRDLERDEWQLVTWNDHAHFADA